MTYWLMKSEPEEYSIDDLMEQPEQTDHWDGIRNYQARNMMRDQMQIGDLVLFYHSNCKPPGVVGIAEVASEAYPDHTAWDPDSGHFDPKSSPDNPRWCMVDIRFKEKFPGKLTLPELRQIPELSNMKILQKGNRLSITPVTETEWNTILRHARAKDQE